MNRHTASRVGCSMAFTVFVLYAVAFGFKDFKALWLNRRTASWGECGERIKDSKNIQLKAAEIQEDRSLFLVVSASLELRPMLFLL